MLSLNPIFLEFTPLGLAISTWKESLARIENKISAEDYAIFLRLHQNFSAYSSTGTLTKFYNFVYVHQLQFEINGPRLLRIQCLFEIIKPTLLQNQTYLDVGAGAGIFGELVRQQFNPTAYYITDIVPAVETYLAGRGFKIWRQQTANIPCNKIFCIDSLGEINADEDKQLLTALEQNAPDAETLLMERYGLEEKLNLWKKSLHPDGILYLSEPVANVEFFKMLAKILTRSGWKCDLIEAGETFLLKLKPSN